MADAESQTEAPLLGEPFAVELMNTVWADRNGVYDELGEPASALLWWRAVEHRLPSRFEHAEQQGHPVPIGREVLQSLRRLRDSLRRLAAEITGDDRPAARSASPDRETAIAVINTASARSPVWSELAWPPGDDAPRRVTQSRSDSASAALGVIAEDAVGFFTGNQRLELRACRAPGCVLYFVRDHPRRQWCSAACGNRARVARHYDRHHRDHDPGPHRGETDA
jgi:predicted RNA-binding Zn ribbon-like protein